MKEFRIHLLKAEQWIINGKNELLHLLIPNLYRTWQSLMNPSSISVTSPFSFLRAQRARITLNDVISYFRNDIGNSLQALLSSWRRSGIGPVIICFYFTLPYANGRKIVMGRVIFRLLLPKMCSPWEAWVDDRWRLPEYQRDNGRRPIAIDERNWREPRRRSDEQFNYLMMKIFCCLFSTWRWKKKFLLITSILQEESHNHYRKNAKIFKFPSTFQLTIWIVSFHRIVQLCFSEHSYACRRAHH